MNATDTVLRLVELINRRDLERALALFTQETVYHNMPVDPLYGVEGVRQILEPFVRGSEEIEWVLHNVAVSESGAVLTERTDRFKLNGQWIALPVMGVFEVRDEKIIAWRDYYDSVDVERQMGAAKAF
jgi:limonene-1,2-epoxide hydrolase